MVDHVKNLREVNHYCQSTVWGQGMVETLGYFMCERDESRNGGMFGTKTMVGGGKREKI